MFYKNFILASLMWVSTIAPSMAQVGQSLAEFEAVSGKPVDQSIGTNGELQLIFNEYWISKKSKQMLGGQTLIELVDNHVFKEVFVFTQPLPNNSEGAADAVGITSNLLPPGVSRKFVDHGLRPYDSGFVLWFDYGHGLYTNFFLDKEQKMIIAVSAGIETTNL